MREVLFGRRKAEKQFEKLDSFARKRIAKEIEEIRNDPNMGTPLTGDLAGYYKYRKDPYRIVYSFTEDKIMIVAIDIRDDVYEELKRYIKGISGHDGQSGINS